MQRSGRIHIEALVATAALVATPAWAVAGKRGGESEGALGQVTRGVAERTESAPVSSGGPSNDRDDDRDSSYDLDDDDLDHTGSAGVGAGYCYGCGPGYVGAAGPPPSNSSVDLALELGLQNVHDSDGAGYVAVRAAQHGFGVAATVTSYFERPPSGDTIRMDLWSLMLTARLLRAPATELWIHGGLTGTRSNRYEQILGPTAGAELLHRFTHIFGGYGSARYYGFEEGVRAYEIRGGIRAAYLSLGYRVVDFNVGPPLRGPEFGLALQF